MFADVEAALLDYLADLGYCCTSTPVNLASLLPALRIQRIGGPDDRDNDYPRVDVQALVAADYEHPRTAWTLAEQVRDRFNKLPAMAGEVLLDYSTTESGPAEVFWPDPAIRCVRAVYRLTIRA